MRLAIVTSTPQSVIRGSGTFVAAITLARTLQHLGHQVHYVSPGSGTGVLGHTVQRFMFNLMLSPTRVTDAEAVIGLDMDGFTLSGTVHPFASFLLGVLADEASFERGYVATLLRLQANAEKRSSQLAEFVITTSEYSRNRLVRLYGISHERISVVPPPFDVDRWQRDVIAHGSRPGGPGRPTVFTVAHMYPRKNLAALVRAALICSRVMPEVGFRIAGGGPEFEGLRRLISELRLHESVSLLGQIPHEQLIAEFASCDVFCLPSLQEGFGIAFLEAMASGKPVVASRASSTPELIRHRVNGLLANPRDESDLAEKLLCLLDDRQLRDRMGATNRADARQYDASVTVPRLVDLFSGA